MLRKVFYKRSQEFPKKGGTASVSYQVSTSTPNVSTKPCGTCPEHRSTEVTVIERSTSAPILVSDASIADLESHLKKCPPSKPCLRPVDSSSCSLMGSPKCRRGCPSRGRCIRQPECPGRREPPKPTCSSAIMTKIEKEVMNRACGGIVKDSTATCSLVDSASPTCDAADRAEYYYNKLLSAQQILENREETIRVQAGSLAVAEARIATFSERAADLRRELDRKAKECQNLRKSLEACKVEKCDACIITDKQMGHQYDIVSTLQDNLSVIEELYRECFYETAKQEDLIEMLRKSYLDVRLMDKQKADQIGRLQTVINTQKWSLDRCQDIALEVDNLKMEISNFLHSSTSTNNDSGMWERSEDSFVSAPGVQDDLQDIVDQLLRLQDILNTDCTCGLEEENKKLKREIESQKSKIEELNAMICGLECTLAAKDEADQKYKKDIEVKEEECTCLKQQLEALEERCKEKKNKCEALTAQLQCMEEKLQDNMTEMLQLQKQNECQANSIKELSEELEKANQLIKENCKVRSEVSFLTAQVALWRAQLTDSEQRVQQLEADLACARGHCEHIEACYRCTGLPC
ncbi:CAP-Gly domain-containing linker protein 1-like isoform X2 [Trichoplusia ni]|uniref:CAP-Gly domain-containing linker protein 1-like isoform X2 n=1 Tax=Trichoplusia ni TaxID=7111 RepID=A0A7E5WBS6_TRINI|nr:CAP-Gly domain-containing linker protein 1-like isoform X2 [Trichoplusia ni]